LPRYVRHHAPRITALLTTQNQYAMSGSMQEFSHGLLRRDDIVERPDLHQEIKQLANKLRPLGLSRCRVAMFPRHRLKGSQQDA
jgi:hypothetical protein